MRGLSASGAPVPIALIIFAVVFVVSFFSLGSVPRHLATRQLSQQGDTVLRTFEHAMQSTSRDLAELPSLRELDCQNGASPLLTHGEFRNEHVRWLGVARDGEIVCSSPILKFDIPPPVKRYRLNEEWSEVMAQTPWGGTNLVLIQKRADTEYLALMQPLPDVTSVADCAQCLSYEVILGSHQEITMKSGETALPNVIGVTDQSVVLTVPVKLIYSATQDFVDTFNSAGRLIAAGISAIIALIVSFLSYGLLLRRTSLENLVKLGLQRNEFVPHYQPIVDARNGEVLGAEALVRWHRAGKLIPPGHFIPFAEESGLIGPITEQIVKKVLDDLRQLGWSATNRYISVNIEPSEIVNSDFCETMLRQISESGIPGKNVAIEITERRQLTNLPEAGTRLLRLAEANVGIKIDDAGTGFGGFSYVQELPVDALKIDKMFVDTISTEADAKRLVLSAIIQFATASGLSIIAEGVETRQQVAYLLTLGVYAIQGYVYARPMTRDELMHWRPQLEVVSSKQSAISTAR